MASSDPASTSLGPSRPHRHLHLHHVTLFVRDQDLSKRFFLDELALVGFDEVSRRLEEERRVVADKVEAEQRAAQELEIARQVQARLFPQASPPLRTLDYAGLCIQARAVGGRYSLTRRRSAAATKG